MLVGLDSTDSLRGGCTTHVAAEIWHRLAEFDVQGAPRLVRLNPNIPYKTRGNGALCLELGHGVGRRRPAGRMGGTDLWAAERIDEPSRAEAARIFQVARETIDELREHDPKTQPGLWMARSPPPEAAYWLAVRTHLDGPAEAPGDHWHGWNGGRGLIGAIAAAAWRPRRGTFELIAYRRAGRYGSRRDLDADLGRRLDAIPGTFDNWDPRHEHLRVAPRSPCPVLAGIRATNPSSLPDALDQLGPEDFGDWMVFATNQATGDHLAPRRLGDLAPYESARIHATVAGEPYTVRGGHTFVRVEDGTGTATAAAYEPTKEFRTAVRGLRAGDGVLLEGSVHSDPRLLALEGITLLEANPRTTTTPDSCASCGRRGRSGGRHGGHRCPRCRRPVSVGTHVERQPNASRITVPILVRRHLSRPPQLSEADVRLPPEGIAA